MKNTSDVGTDQMTAAHISGTYAVAQSGSNWAVRVRDLLGDDVGGIVVEWHRNTLGHGRDPIDPATGKQTTNPYVDELLAIPVTEHAIVEKLAEVGVSIPTRQQMREFAEADLRNGGDGIDPEVELARAALVADPDLNAAAGAGDKRINGVPESVFDLLEPHEQQKVIAGDVIAPPQSPTAVARWLVRTKYTHRLPLPDGYESNKRRRRRAYMRTLIRVDQTWYHYTRLTATDPPRWVPRTDPEWMRAQLRGVLGRLWYVKTRQLKGGDEYSLKWWNPDTRTLANVEDALADELNVGTGTRARELPDRWGQQHNVYSGGTWALVRKGVLDVESGRLLPNTPLWFSLSRIEADYDHAADPTTAHDWLRVLDAQWHDDPGAIACLQQWFGYVLSGRTDLHKFMWVFGPPGSAKSLVTAVLEALVGVVTELGLDALNSQFGLQHPYETGATLAVMSDMRFGTRDSNLATSRLLAIIGGDTVDIPRKYKGSVKDHLPVRFHGSANEMPKLSDHAGALVDRMLILETSRSFKRGAEGTDPGLAKRIIANELGLVLRWAVEGLAKLNAADGQFTLSKNADELYDDAAVAMSNVRQFVAECCEIGTAEDCVDQDALFRVWGKWAAENKSGERTSKAAFRRSLKSIGDGQIKPGQKFKGPRVVWGIKRAETRYADRDRFGQTVERTVSTEIADGDPWGRDGAA
ncbi:DNA primase family protein [Mycolicibacterium elephantis]|uniref:DNA primase family protein n=1 Tax=Mycolicibacterium elephantis TaxID=81858 RepID=UPI000FE1A4B9|nr:hypothetical protein [Mycolicibacterium elephantis]MCV7223631.1 hypothetical protein [Mycolicibacterium elephantis]